MYEPHIRGNPLAISFQSVAELWHLAEASGWSERRRVVLHAFLRQFSIIPYDYDLAQEWARVSANAARIGRPLESGDAWILATAVQRRIPLITHDRDFLERSIAGLRVISRL